MANVTTVAIRGANACGKIAVKLDPSDAVKPPEANRAILEKVNNVWGSCAGSGSDAFPLYRKMRNAELARIEKMDKDWEDLQHAEAFQAKREARFQRDEEQAAAKRAKRQRKKDAKVQSAKLRKEASGINKFAGDGS